MKIKEDKTINKIGSISATFLTLRNANLKFKKKSHLIRVYLILSSFTTNHLYIQAKNSFLYQVNLSKYLL